MKMYERCLLMVLCLMMVGGAAATRAGPIEPPVGVDTFRGAWGGILAAGGVSAQLNFYLNEVMPDPVAAGDPTRFVATGCLSISGHQPNRRAKAPTAPLSARLILLGDGEVQMTLLSTLFFAGEGQIIRLVGTADIGGASVVDDRVEDGVFETAQFEGTWEAQHLDRRRVHCDGVDPDDPVILYEADVYGHSNDSYFGSILELRRTNLAAAAIRVTLPGGTEVDLPPYTDVFSPDVDFVSLFRFIGGLDELPVAGGIYTFAALDILGQPIPGAVATDIYVGGYELPPPTDVQLAVDAGGILVTWNQVTVLPGAFDPASGVGFNQITLLQRQNGDWHDVYGAAGIAENFTLIPNDVLQALLDEHGPGHEYRLLVSSFSVAPYGSAGDGLEFNATQSDTPSFILTSIGPVLSTASAGQQGIPVDGVERPADGEAGLRSDAIRLDPNPVRDTNTAHFTFLGDASAVRVQVMDLAGCVVFDSGVIPGTECLWHLENQAGDVVANGVYVYRLMVYDDLGAVADTETGRISVLR